MPSSRLLVRSLSGCALAALVLTGTGCPKAPPPKLPPREVPRLGQVGDTTGERSDVVADAVQQGSNQARIQFDCAAHSQGVEGRGLLSADIAKCEYDYAQKTLTISSDSAADCPTLLLTVTSFRGPGTYNTSSLGALSLGTAKMRHAACSWDGTMCLNWNGASGPHPESSCTIEISSDGGLQYGTTGSTVSGTFVCDDFVGPWKGCAGAPAKTSCIVSRASFSAAGCNVINKDTKPEKGDKKGDKKGKGKK